MEISFTAEKLFDLGPISVTNSLLSAFVIVSFLSLFFIVLSTKIKQYDPTKTQLFLEMLYLALIDIVQNILGSKTKKLFPFLLSLFIFIIFSNWFGLLPIVGPIGIIHNEVHEESASHVEQRNNQNKIESDLELNDYNDRYVVEGSIEDVNKENGDGYKDESKSNLQENSHHSTYHQVSNIENKEAELEISTEEEKITLASCLKKRDCVLTTELKLKKAESLIPLFRAPTSDISGTLALALISVIMTNALGVSVFGLKYFKKFMNPLDIVEEIGKILSFTFRLFGNVFAGEVILVIITSISFGLATLPFMLLEVFVGFIQALVFFILTAVFMSLSTSHH